MLFKSMLFVILSSFGCLRVAQVHADTPPDETPPVSTAPSSVEPATFHQQPARVGDRVAQHVTTALDLQTTILQSAKVANQSSTRFSRQQKRFIEVLEVVEGRAKKAHVTFPLSRQYAPENGVSSPETVQCVEGKSYIVVRQGNRLVVTDSSGAIPPQEEFSLVVNSLQSLGLPSPLVKYLLGRTVKIGEQLQLPKQIAEEMLGVDGQLGKAEKFDLKLQELKMVDEQPCAVFVATIEAQGDPDNPVTLRARGEVLIQINTCRTVSAKLEGPLRMSTLEKTSEGEFEYKAQGTMQVAIHSQYGYAAK
jgi:hypothetical protein